MKNTYETPLSADLISTVKSIVEQPLDELFGSNPQGDLHKHLAKLGYSRDGNTHTRTNPNGHTSHVETHASGAKHTVTDRNGTVKNSSSYSFSSAKPSHIASRVDYHSRSAATAAGDNTHREGYEPIEELSKATLGRYIKAASSSLIPSQRTQDRQFNAARDLSYTDPESSKYHAGKGVKTGKKIINRRDGIDKATDKLTKESKED
jgi:hypothetical protein